MEYKEEKAIYVLKCKPTPQLQENRKHIAKQKNNDRSNHQKEKCLLEKAKSAKKGRSSEISYVTNK